ncbi:MAG: glycosyltransferase family 4 protein [Bacteroidales bacterium]|nr:glycosyltransferase family 4 protein [Bacteroidales bacterium]
MKILVLSPKPPWPPHDGGAVAILRGIEGLAFNGAEISLLSMRTEKHGLPVPEAGKEHLSFLHSHETVEVDTRIRQLKMLHNLLFSREPYDLARFRSDEFSRVMCRVIRDGGFDLVQCEGILFTSYLGKIRNETSVPVVLRAHNVEHRIREMMSDQASGRLRRAYLGNLAGRIKRCETDAARLFDAIIPISEPDRQWFSSVAPEEKPLLLSETGAALTGYINEPDKSDFKVGFIGALNWEPNVQGLKWFTDRVWPLVCKALPAASLHIAGRGAPASKPSWLRERNINWVGEADDARQFMASVNVIVAPLFAGSGLRIKIIEAMSIGRPVVATPVAVHGIPAVNGRELFIADDVSSFSNALINLLNDRELRKSTGETAAALVKERYDNTARTAELLEFYKQLCHGR